MDPTSLWVILKTKQRQIAYVTIIILVFALGWHLGRIMSPYYAAQPIVFDDSAVDTKASSGGTAAELVALREAGEQAQVSPDTHVAQAAASSTPAVGESAPSPTGIVAAATTSTRTFVGSKNSTLYHHVTCSAGQRIKAENQIWWNTKEEAEAAGYSPSACTKEKLGL